MRSIRHKEQEVETAKEDLKNSLGLTQVVEGGLVQILSTTSLCGGGGEDKVRQKMRGALDKIMNVPRIECMIILILCPAKSNQTKHICVFLQCRYSTRLIYPTL